MIDRLVHHAEILALKGDSYRLKDRDRTDAADRKPDPPPQDTCAPTRLRLGLRPSARSTRENTRKVA